MKLTDADLNAIKSLMEVTFDEKSEDFVRKNDISHLPTKDEFYTETAKLYKKMEKMEEEVIVRNHQIKRNANGVDKNRKKIKKLENIVSMN